MTRLRHFDRLNTARFVTFSCYRHLPGLNSPVARDLFVAELKEQREKHRFRLLAYVVMPDHVHLVIWPVDGASLGHLVGELKSRSARRILSLSGPPIEGARRIFWQRRCYDHNCRRPDTVREKIIYCHNNPVRQGLVDSPEAWVWSSCRSYLGFDGSLIPIDRIDM